MSDPGSPPVPTRGHSGPGLVLAVAVGLFLALWWPALSTPFWGDDYGALVGAAAANQQGQSWWQTFFPSSPLPFWRPLSQDAYWRLVEGVLQADPRAAHALNLGLLALASVAVGFAGAALARAAQWERALPTGCLGGALYSVLALHFLPVHWVAAANSSLSVVFTALMFAAFLGAGRADGRPRAVWLVAVPLLQGLALLSKESAVLLPGLLVVVWLLAGGRRPGRAQGVAWLASVLLVLAWLWLHPRFALNQDAAYQLQFGSNVLRNAASLLLWGLNLPREAVRMAVDGQSLKAGLWSLAVVLPALAAVALALWRRAWRPGGAIACLVAAYVLLAYAPYFFLAWNSYAYYAATAAIVPVLVLARCVAATPRALAVLLLLGLSSLLAVEGSRRLPSPGLVGRAHWAGQLLDGLAAAAPAAPLQVIVDDPQRFYAIGTPGLAWRLGLAPDQVQVVEHCQPRAGSCWRIDGEGRLRQGAVQPSAPP
jgi:hypothetical protein